MNDPLTNAEKLADRIYKFWEYDVAAVESVKVSEDGIEAVVTYKIDKPKAEAVSDALKDHLYGIGHFKQFDKMAWDVFINARDVLYAGNLVLRTVAAIREGKYRNEIRAEIEARRGR